MNAIQIIVDNRSSYQTESTVLDALINHFDLSKVTNVLRPYCIHLNLDTGKYYLTNMIIANGEVPVGSIAAYEFRRTYDKFMNTPIINNKKQQNKLWKSE